MNNLDGTVDLCSQPAPGNPADDSNEARTPASSESVASPSDDDVNDYVRSRASILFAGHQLSAHQRVDRMFAALMFVQWFCAIGLALWLSPRTWAGAQYRPHIHVWAALLLGGASTLYPALLVRFRSGSPLTRHVIAASQLIMSGLLIHLTGGRIESHFHVFGSLAFLAFYRDIRLIITATVVTAADHVLRGLLWPQSIYGIAQQQDWRWLEHAGWVVFEDTFLIISCIWGLRELWAVCERDALLEHSNSNLEKKVTARTALLQAANSRLEALATTDALTGLPNHRALVELTDREVDRSRRYNRSFALLFIDLDHFKALNDSCGHEAGDTALIELGAIARKCLRAVDTLGRWGGEEFVAILPETDLQTAIEVAERLRAMVAAHRFGPGGAIFLTCSIGLSAYPDNGDSRAMLVSSADRAMYASKYLGRNQVRLASDPIVDTLDSAEHGSREDLALMGTVEAIVGLVEARDTYTAEHTESVAELATRIAREMELSSAEIKLTEIVAKLHDIGKVAIPDIVLNKPGKLTDEEWEIMKTHSAIGADIAERVPALRAAAAGIRSHHEQWNGAGYPDGLAKESIPLSSRIVSVADTFNAITTDRPYRPRRSREEALEIILSCTGSQFDPRVVESFMRVMAQTELGETKIAA